MYNAMDYSEVGFYSEIKSPHWAQINVLLTWEFRWKFLVFGSNTKLYSLGEKWRKISFNESVVTEIAWNITTFELPGLKLTDLKLVQKPSLTSHVLLQAVQQDLLMIKGA